ncbi:MAG: hypothetical protein MJZ96_06790 [Paludibacteraceae bacterium]|nr:hypothetical protein [Paludibacteraceae bacterium]
MVDLNNPEGTDPEGGPSTGSGTGTAKKYTLSVTSANTAQGTVSGGGTYNEGASATITATPKSGYQFDKWSDGNTSATRTINVSKDLTLTASFKVVSSGGGTESGGESGGYDFT